MLGLRCWCKILWLLKSDLRRRVLIYLQDVESRTLLKKHFSHFDIAFKASSVKNRTREADRGNNMVLLTPDCEIQTRYFELTEGCGGFWGSSDWLMVTNYFHREILVTTSCISHCKENIYCDPTTAPSFFVAAGPFCLYGREEVALLQVVFRGGSHLVLKKPLEPVTVAFIESLHFFRSFLNHVEPSIFWTPPLAAHCICLATQDPFALMPTRSHLYFNNSFSILKLSTFLRSRFLHKRICTWRAPLVRFSPFLSKHLQPQTQKRLRQRWDLWHVHNTDVDWGVWAPAECKYSEFSPEVVLAARSARNLKPAADPILSWNLQKKHVDVFL